MNWISLEDAFPEENGLYWVIIESKGVILRLYDNDSFGLGDDDFNVLAWQQFRSPCKPDVKGFFQNQLCTSPELDHRDVDSSILYRHLV